MLYSFQNEPETFRMTAKTFFGLENILAAELESLGATKIRPKNRAVVFEGDKKVLYAANLWLRTALRILVPIHTFRAKNEDELYKIAKEIPWENYMNTQQFFAIDSVTYSDHFKHSKYAGLRLKDAIVDYFREKTGLRPSVNVDTPDLLINLHITEVDCVISFDASGDSLHKRGYRLQKNEAPLNEVLAAGMVLLTKWDKTSNFIDGMCGSGTIPIEAALIAANIPPCDKREKFGFMRWNNFDAALWNQIKQEAETSRIETEALIAGGDISERNIKIARQNAERAGVSDLVYFSNKSFEKNFPEEGGGVAIINPPYGERMKKEEIEAFYKSIGDTLKAHYLGYDVWIISSNMQALKLLGLYASPKLTLYNGSLECKFQRYSIYEGTKKNKSSHYQEHPHDDEVES